MSQSVAYRNRACDTLHPGWAMRAGTAKRSRLFLEWGNTLGHRRLFSSGYGSTDAKQGRSSQEALQRPHSFCVYDTNCEVTWPSARL